MKIPGVARGVKTRPALKPKAAPSPVPAAPKAPPAAPSRASSAGLAAAGPYGSALAGLDKSERAARDIAARRQNDNLAYTTWQQTQQAKLGVVAQQADMAASRATLAAQIVAARGTAQTQNALAAQRAGRTDVATAGSGNSTQGLVSDAALTQALLANAQQKQASDARSSQGKAGFLQAAVAASGQAAGARIAGEESSQLADIGTQRSKLLVDQAKQDTLVSQKEADRASRESVAAASRDVALSGQESRANTAAADRAARAAQGHASRVAASKRAKLSGAGAAAKPKYGDARTLEHTYETLKSAASALKSPTTGRPSTYSEAKAAMIQLYPDLASNSTALNAALSAIYDPKAKGGKPRGKALTDYNRERSDLLKGR